MIRTQLLSCPDAAVVHAFGMGQSQVNLSVASPRLSTGKPTRRSATKMGSNELVAGEDHLLGPSCQWHNWQTSRKGSIAFDILYIGFN